jgi:cytochrome b561
MRNTVDRYGPVARGLHWAIGLLIIGQLIGGFVAFELMGKSAERSALIGVHKAMGVMLLLLVLARIGWRLYDAPPALPAAMPERERQGARVGHALLYLLMLAMPLIGLSIGAFADRPTDVFGLFTVPAFFTANESMHDLMEDLHVWGAYLFGALIVLHLAAALMHKFIRKDGIADRMI